MKQGIVIIIIIIIIIIRSVMPLLKHFFYKMLVIKLFSNGHEKAQINLSFSYSKVKIK